MNVQRWTNPSVRQFAGEADPVSLISELARNLVARAVDEGWTGPPFDLVDLARRLGIDVIARDDLRDARIVPVGSGFRIEFNPTRPRGRMRYSIAHEIAHTLFPDCAAQARHRAARAELTPTDWQLEALCNVAAAEFVMPFASFGDEPDTLTVDHLLKMRERYDVSAEAMFIRAVHVTKTPVLMFCASPAAGHLGGTPYNINYSIGSRAWPTPLRHGLTLPSNSVVSECTAIGFTAKGTESWDSPQLPLHVEAVGVSPYPGAVAPRVIGIARTGRVTVSGTVLRYLYGSALKPRGPEHRLVVHIVNDKTANWGGGGFAAKLRSAWPTVQASFKAWAAEQPRLSLGSVHFAEAAPDITVASMVCQKGYGPSLKPRIRYLALREALAVVADYARAKSLSVHLPRIGCGEAGGSWEVVSELLDSALCANGIAVTVYDLPSSPFSGPRQASLLASVS